MNMDLPDSTIASNVFFPFLQKNKKKHPIIIIYYPSRITDFHMEMEGGSCPTHFIIAGFFASIRSIWITSSCCIKESGTLPSQHINGSTGTCFLIALLMLTQTALQKVGTELHSFLQAVKF
ncbi:hypothetical protein XENOCAPTIV_030625 [Xenoophorus captivus]|uniref:Uncharacterized protein n=1 Tax=Xenoophorus captivus TaxID=1517983 RepID=A0ABV0RSF5_9TELE